MHDCSDPNGPYHTHTAIIVLHLNISIHSRWAIDSYSSYSIVDRLGVRGERTKKKKCRTARFGR